MRPRALLLACVLSAVAAARDGGAMNPATGSYLQFLERVRPTAPGVEGPATMVLARLAQDDAWLGLYAGGKPVTLFLPTFEATMPELAQAVSRFSAGSLSGFYGAGDVKLPPGAVLMREDHAGPVTIRWISGALPFAAAAPPPVLPRVMEAPVKLSPDDVQRLTRANLAHLPRARRVTLDPAKRAYELELSSSMGPTRLAQTTLGFETPTRDEVSACERAFLEGVARDLETGSATVVTPHRRHAFIELFTRFTEYEAQVTGWTALGARYLFSKFRRPSPRVPPLDQEYFVKDGGAAYFEFQCQLPQRTLFNVYVHGEA